MLEILKKALHLKAFITALSVLLAFIAYHYIGHSSGPWLLLAAFVVCQITRGAPLRQAMIYFALLVLIAMVLPPYTMEVIKARFVDVLIGSVLGVVCTQLLLSRKVYAAFSRDMLPLLSALSVDLKSLTALLDTADKSAVPLLQSEMVLANSELYPEWVFAVGFNPLLRKGYRFFLLNLERLAEIMFALNYLIQQMQDVALRDAFRADLSLVMNNNEKLLEALSTGFSNDETDFTSDMQALEATLNRLVPVGIELIDISPQYIVFTSVVRLQKDMREVLLRLAMALPALVPN